jgi:hypothetical protein
MVDKKAAQPCLISSVSINECVHARARLLGRILGHCRVVVCSPHGRASLPRLHHSESQHCKGCEEQSGFSLNIHTCLPPMAWCRDDRATDALYPSRLASFPDILLRQENHPLFHFHHRFYCHVHYFHHPHHRLKVAKHRHRIGLTDVTLLKDTGHDHAVSACLSFEATNDLHVNPRGTSTPVFGLLPRLRDGLHFNFTH